MQIEEVIPGFEVIGLLERCNLLTSDVSKSTSQHFFGWLEDEVLYAVVGVEIFDTEGLLRSLAVAPEMRGLGHARFLVAHAESFAKKNGVSALFLLTNTATTFFSELGYKTLPRCDAPISIRQTAQFAGLCEASSAFMGKHLYKS